MAPHIRRPLHRRPPLHDADAATPAQVARQQNLARALPALAHYHPGKSWAGAYIPVPAPSDRHWHFEQSTDERRLLAILDELGDEEGVE